MFKFAKRSRLKKLWTRIGWVALVVFGLMNVIAAVHAYKFTHFSIRGVRNEQVELSWTNKLRLLFTGVDNPRPIDAIPPSGTDTVIIKSNVNLECWMIPAKGQAKGTVALFHGYTGCKTKLIPRAIPLVYAGYNCLLVGFMGSGRSGGNSTTVGFAEAQEVAHCYEYIRKKYPGKVFLFGSSMGAVAIMKAIDDDHLTPDAVVLECPFATMNETVSIRFKKLGVPTFPMAGLLVFWGGLENGFWGFSHNPVDYARAVKCPVLMQYGRHDELVAPNETQRIFHNLGGPKQLVIYEQSGHDNYIDKEADNWKQNVVAFLNTHS